MAVIKTTGKGKGTVAGNTGVATTPQARTASTSAEKNWKKWTAEDCLANMDVVESTDEYTREMLLAYIAYHMPSLKTEAKGAEGVEPWDYVAGSLSNAVNDGDVEWEQFSAIEEPADEAEDAGDAGTDSQEIIEVSKERVKEALKVLLTTRNKVIAMLYEKHDEYNAQYFEGALTTPVITIEKMDNRTLANYTYEGNPMAVDQHIRFNMNFIALNEDWRILETLRHEMIHQWQDEVAYGKHDGSELKMTKLPKIDTETKAIVFEDVMQKRRPKETHNNDFRLYAAIVGIPANGVNCTGNPAEMPEPQSYNHKFVCGCKASNKYMITVYSTRIEVADMYECKKCIAEGRSGKLTVVSKERPNSKTINATKSHIEAPNQDAIHDEMTAKYSEFTRFETKILKDGFVNELMGGELEGGVPTGMEQGVYQKGHNAYKWGHRYWVAYSMPDGVSSKPKKVKKDKPAPKPPEAPVADDAPVVEPKTRKRKEKPVEAQPAPQAAKVEPKAEEPKTEAKPRKGKILSFPKGEPTPAADREYSADNPQDILDLYSELLTVTKVAARLNTPKTTLLRKIKKYQIDFNTKTFAMPE